MPHRPWWARWNTGPARAAPTRPTTPDTPTTSAARVRIDRAAPAAPTTATDAYEPMLSATSRKNRPWPVGSSETVGVTSVTLSGTPCCVATGVKIFSAVIALMSDPAVATISSGDFALRTYAPSMSRDRSCSTAAERLSSVRTSSASPALSFTVWAKTFVSGPAPTTATGRWCGSGATKAPMYASPMPTHISSGVMRWVRTWRRAGFRTPCTAPEDSERCALWSAGMGRTSSDGRRARRASAYTTKGLVFTTFAHVVLYNYLPSVGPGGGCDDGHREPAVAIARACRPAGGRGRQACWRSSWYSYVRCVGT